MRGKDATKAKNPLPGGVYHVILRGNDRQKIFFCDGDRLRLEDLLTRGMDRYDCCVHAYCWMTNHIHMAIQVGDIPLWNLMRWIASQYAKTLNARRGRETTQGDSGRCGPVFAGFGEIHSPESYQSGNCRSGGM